MRLDPITIYAMTPETLSSLVYEVAGAATNPYYQDIAAGHVFPAERVSAEVARVLEERGYAEAVL